MDRLKMMETFVRIARSGSYAKAAKQLGVSRSQVTKHMQQLETHLKVRLFNRTTRQVALTEIGNEYYGFCLRILNEIEEEERAVTQLNIELNGALKIVSPMGFGNFQLAPIVADFMLLYPNVKVAVVLNDIAMSPVEMIDGGFDLAIQLGELPATSILSRRVGDAPWVTCAAPAYLQRVGRPKDLADLGQHNCFVHRKTTPDSAWHYMTPEGKVSVRVEGTMTSNSVYVLRAAVLAGAGIAILPRYCADEDLANGRMEAILTQFPVVSRPISVLFAHSRFPPTKVRTFVSFLCDRLKSSASP